MIDIIAMYANGTPLSSSRLPTEKAQEFLFSAIRQGAKRFRILSNGASLHLGTEEIFRLFRINQRGVTL